MSKKITDMKYRLAIFDLDGTLLDTLDDLTDATNVALRENGYPIHTKKEICAFVGDGIKKLIERAVPLHAGQQDIARVFAAFVAYYTAHCADKTAPYEGIIPLLHALRAAGVKTAVLSNKADHATKALCNLYFAGLFDVVVGERESEGIPKKPAPDGVFAIMRECGTAACDTVYIGDSEVDLVTAKNAGTHVISVAWGFRSVELLRENGAKVFADTPRELEALILNM